MTSPCATHPDSTDVGAGPAPLLCSREACLATMPQRVEKEQGKWVLSSSSKDAKLLAMFAAEAQARTQEGACVAQGTRSNDDDPDSNEGLGDDAAHDQLIPGDKNTSFFKEVSKGSERKKGASERKDDGGSEVDAAVECQRDHFNKDNANAVPSTGNSGNNTSLVEGDASRPHGGSLAESPPSNGVSAPEEDGVAEDDAKHVPEKGGGAVASRTEGEDDATSRRDGNGNVQEERRRDDVSELGSSSSSDETPTGDSPTAKEVVTASDIAKRDKKGGGRNHQARREQRQQRRGKAKKRWGGKSHERGEGR